MTKEEWIKRCAARFYERAAWLTAKYCDDEARLCFAAEFADGIFDESLEHCPEDAADEEMSYWADDEATP